MAHVAATRSTRWWRPPALGTSWRSGTPPGDRSRTRRLRRYRVGLPSEPRPRLLKGSPRSCFSWRFSFRSRRSSSRSAELSPSALRPSSRSASLTHSRIVQYDGSNSLASSATLRPARASSTICRRNSDGYGGLLLGIVDSSRVSRKVSTETGQVQGGKRRWRPGDSSFRLFPRPVQPSLWAAASQSVGAVKRLRRFRRSKGISTRRARRPRSTPGKCSSRRGARCPLQNIRDFEELERGFIAPMPDLQIMADAGHVAWDMERFPVLQRTAGLRQHPPVAGAPIDPEHELRPL